jgi:hypothetical protein
MKLTTHPHLARKLRINEVFTVCTGTVLVFPLEYTVKKILKSGGIEIDQATSASGLR